MTVCQGVRDWVFVIYGGPYGIDNTALARLGHLDCLCLYVAWKLGAAAVGDGDRDARSRPPAK
jgi:hypothetical protein